jgi:VanZ family protein
MRTHLRYPRVWLVVGWSLVILAVLGSLLPAKNLPPVPTSDKLQHFVGYAVLALWFAGIYPRSRYPLIAGGLFLLGIGIEFAQSVMGLGRQADPLDVLANATGIAFGLAAALLGLGSWAAHVERLIIRP